MPSKVKISDQNELEEFARTHLGHRLSAMVAPICLPENHPRWNDPSRRNDAYRAAKEGSYSMLRLFIEFLGVKEDRKNSGKLKAADGEDDTILLDAFSQWGVRTVGPQDFGTDEALVAQVHRNLCKINAHFTYDSSKPAFYDRIASPDDDKEWRLAVEVIVKKLDEFFYSKVNLPITVHLDLVTDFDAQFAKRLQLKSSVKGDELRKVAPSETIRPNATLVAKTDADILRCFPVMAELRTHLVADQFVERVRQQQRQGYQLAFVEDGGAVKSVAGFRMGDYLCWGHILYVDDLVTTKEGRSKGYGQQLIDWLIAHARAQGCEQFHLDSGVEKFAAHRFYLRNRMHISSHHFSLKL